MSGLEAAAAAIMAVPERERSGTLRTFGVWFGRPWDNVHHVTAARAEGRDLILTFGKGEQLVVREPRGVEVRDGRLRIADAERVRWSWVPYGSPEGTPAEWFEYARDARGVGVTSSAHGGLRRAGDPESPAVELL